MTDFLLQQGRAPRDDAPSCNPLCWEDDPCYVTRLAKHLRQKQPPPERRRSDPLDGAAAAATSFYPSERYAAFHALPPRTAPRGVVRLYRRLMHYLWPSYFPPSPADLCPKDLASLTADELLTLMQLALAAGEKDRSGLIAKELSRRRVTVAFQPHGAPPAPAAAAVAPQATSSAPVSYTSAERPVVSGTAPSTTTPPPSFLFSGGRASTLVGDLSQSTDHLWYAPPRVGIRGERWGPRDASGAWQQRW